jgi:hypothetical protein
VKTLYLTFEGIARALQALHDQGDKQVIEMAKWEVKEIVAWIDNVIASKYHSKLANRVIEYAHVKNRLKGLE